MTKKALLIKEKKEDKKALLIKEKKKRQKKALLILSYLNSYLFLTLSRNNSNIYVENLWLLIVILWALENLFISLGNIDMQLEQRKKTIIH